MKKRLPLLLLLCNISFLLYATNNIYTDFNAYNSNTGNCGTLVDNFNSYTNSSNINGLFNGLAPFSSPFPSSFWGGWNTGQVLGGSLIPEPRFQSKPVVLNFNSPVFKVGADVFDDYDGIPGINKITLTVTTTCGNIFSVSENYQVWGYAGFLGASSSEGIVSAIFSIDGMSGNLEIDNLNIGLMCPLFTCPPTITQCNEPGKCGATVNWNPPTMNGDACATLSCSHTPNTFFPVGSTQVCYTAKNATGKTVGTCCFLVIVDDCEKPQITCPSDISTCPTTPISWNVPVTSDNCSTFLTCSHVQNTVFNVGITPVVYTVSDSKANTTTCSFLVIVSPPPYISAGNDITVCQGATAVLSATGNGNFLWSNGSNNSSISVSPSATSSFQVSLTDANGCKNEDEVKVSLSFSSKTNLVFKRCSGETIAIGNSIYSKSGIYVDILKNKNGCDSVVTSNIMISPTYKVDLQKTICNGEIVKIGAKIFANQGKYSVVLQSKNGCDSTVNLDLKVIEPFVTKDSVTLCINQLPFQKHGNTYTKAGKHDYKLIASTTNCDSFFTFLLFVENFEKKQDFVNRCEGETYKIGQSIYTKSGNYIDTLDNANACKTIVYTDLIIHKKQFETIQKTICFSEKFNFDNQNLTQSGIFKKTIKNKYACDSLITTLNLLVLPKNESSFSKIICKGDAVTIGTESFNQTGVFSKILISKKTGCDSFVTLNLMVLAPKDTLIKQMFCDGDDFYFNQKKYNTTGIFKDIIAFKNQKCDSVNVTLDLIFESCQIYFSTLNIENVKCFGKNNGSINFQFYGGKKPYTFDYQNITNGKKYQNGDNLPAGQYKITIKDSGVGTKQIVKDTIVNITEPTQLLAYVSNTTTSDCKGNIKGTVKVSTQNGTPNYTYQWSNGGGNTDTLTIKGKGIYSVTITDKNACFKIIQDVNVPQREPFLVKAEPTLIKCTGEQNGKVEIKVSGTEASSCLYQKNNETPTKNNFFNNLKSGNYTFKVIDKSGCEDSVKVNLPEPKKVSVDLGFDQSIFYGDSLQLKVESNALKIVWKNENPCVSCPSIWIKPQKTTTYQVSVFDANGCKAEDFLTIDVKFDHNTYVPNAFSPNSDGENDIFTILGSAKLQRIKRFSVFDRWGEMIYDEYDFSPNGKEKKGWNGDFRTQAAEEGVYVYRIEVEFVDGFNKMLQGDVLLIR